jgi:hypothetical protein
MKNGEHIMDKLSPTAKFEVLTAVTIMKNTVFWVTTVAAYSSETSVNTYQTSWLHIPEESMLILRVNYNCNNLWNNSI